MTLFRQENSAVSFQNCQAASPFDKTGIETVEMKVLYQCFNFTEVDDYTAAVSENIFVLQKQLLKYSGVKYHVVCNSP